MMYFSTVLHQTKAAMTTILSDLREGDYFNLITFSDKVHTWKKGRTVRATRQNVRDAKEFVRKIIAEGCGCFFCICTFIVKKKTKKHFTSYIIIIDT